jgi:hypothetical protein
MSERPKVRWHDCLTIIKPPAPAGPQGQLRFTIGQRIHELIQKVVYSEFQSEVTHTPDCAEFFHDETLPVDIIFHVDLYDNRHNIVYDIKPATWSIRELDYCIAQLSGYKHFMRAKAAQLILYRILNQKPVEELSLDDFIFFPYNPPYLYTWDELKPIVVQSLRVLKVIP